MNRQTQSRAAVQAIAALALVITLAVALSARASERAARPNVLWLTCEDMSPTLGCYGDTYANTPHIDKLAGRSIRYTQAVGIAGVCAVNRSCLITGMYPSTIGSQDMRSRIRLPESIPTCSRLMRDAGYYCTNNAKTDYNFPTPPDAWDACSGKAHWRHRDPGQPFFAVFNYDGTHESRIREPKYSQATKGLTAARRHDPADVPVPPFHPDTPEVRRDWANHYDTISALDRWVADHLADLEEAGLADDTIVFFYSDHGVGLPMCKKWPYDWGLRVPLLIHFPEKYAHLAPDKPGSVDDRLVSFVDFPPTLLSLVGAKVPGHMQGRAFLGDHAPPPRDYAFAIRNRHAEQYACVRVVRDSQYQYHRNFLPHLPWAPFGWYTMKMPTAQVWTKLHAQGQLTPAQSRYFLPKPTEELYDVRADPHMVHNLADDPRYAHVVERMSAQLRDWQLRTRDTGLMSEYEMHRRADGSTQYVVGQSEAAYPLTRILPVAEMAGDRDPANLPELVRLLDDPEPIVRWWAALGLVMLGDEAAPAEAALRRALADGSPVVRVAAAEAVYQLGHADPARDTLVQALAHPTPFVRLRAVNVLNRMGNDARPAADAIEQAAMDGMYPADYLNRMTRYVPERLR